MVKSKKDLKNLPLRNGVGIILLNQNNKIFVAKRIDNPNNYWQMPQGGIDPGENDHQAAIRELYEETSVKSVSLIKEIDGYTIYYLPERLLGIIWKGKFKGQKQKWFIMRFLGEESEIDINTKKPEFLEWKWIDANSLTKNVVDFKIDVYKKVELEVQKFLTS